MLNTQNGLQEINNNRQTTTSVQKASRIYIHNYSEKILRMQSCRFIPAIVPWKN
jgi:hypothetical protein